MLIAIVIAEENQEIDQHLLPGPANLILVDPAKQGIYVRVSLYVQ